MDKMYLGDGVYVEHDGYQLRLTTQRAIEHEIYLEPSMVLSLVQYVERIKEKYVNPQ